MAENQNIGFLEVNEEVSKMKGKVKFFNDAKGFGFIAAEDGKEYFVHITGLSSGLQSLNENDDVVFDVVDGDKGPKADKVSLDDGSAPADAPADDAADAEDDSEE